MDQTVARNGVDVVSLLVEFLETAIHQILYTRSLYPSNIFVLKKKYNIPVWVSIHPGVNYYINSTLTAVKQLVTDRKLQSLSVVFLSGRGEPIEKHILDILNLQPDLSERTVFGDPYLIRLEGSLREYLLKVGAHDYKVLPEDSSFRLIVRTTEQGSVALSHNPALQEFPFVNTEEKERNIENSTLVPLHTVSCDFFRVQIYTKSENGICRVAVVSDFCSVPYYVGNVVLLMN